MELPRVQLRVEVFPLYEIAFDCLTPVQTELAVVSKWRP